MTLRISPHATDVFAYRTVVLGLFKLSIKARHEIRVFEGRSVNAGQWGHYMAFKHRISFATYLAANFGCVRFRITPDIISKLLRAATWSRCAVQFESEQTPLSETGRQFRPAVLHRIQFETCVFVSVSYFTQRLMTDTKTEQSNGRCFGLTWKKIVSRRCQKFTKH